MSAEKTEPLVGVVMGSKSDWEVMRAASDMLEKLEIPCEVRVLSAHRTPDALFDWIADADSRPLAHWWLVLFPTVAIAITVIAANTVAEGVARTARATDVPRAEDGPA